LGILHAVGVQIPPREPELGSSSPYFWEETCQIQMGLQDQVHMDGQINKYKARLVTKGFQQVHGIEYDETFSPVVNMDSIQLTLSIMVDKGMGIPSNGSEECISSW
jgi:hypothetical protein